MIEELTNFWNSEFDDFAPEAHNLKHEYRDRWVRFHSLPESKRYPENEDEYLEVFRRYNSVLQELYGNGSKVLVVLPEYSEERVPTNPEPALLMLFSVCEPWCSIAQHEDDDDYESYWHLHVTEVELNGSKLDNLFRMVANDEAGNIMIICPRKGIVFHPYDGGADIVLPTTEKREQLKVKYHQWLSSHPEGF